MEYLFVTWKFLFRISLKNLFLRIYYNHLFCNLKYKFFLLVIEAFKDTFFDIYLSVYQYSFGDSLFVNTN